MTRVFSAMGHRILRGARQARGGWGCLSFFPLRASISQPSLIAKAAPPACDGARGGPCLFFVPPDSVGGAERRQALVRKPPHPVVRLASGPISGSPEMTGQ